MSIFTKEFNPIRFSKKSEGIAGAILGLIFVVGVPVLLIYIFISPLLSNNESAQTKTYEPDEIELHIQAQQFVKQGLKAPSTAKFPVLPYDTSMDGNGLYKVDSYVDSQNSFGAMIRSDWSVLMRLQDERWILQKMIIGNKVVYDIAQNE